MNNQKLATSVWEEKRRKRIARFGTVVNLKIYDVARENTWKTNQSTAKVEAIELGSEENSKKCGTTGLIAITSIAAKDGKILRHQEKIEGELPNLFVPGETALMSMQDMNELDQNRRVDRLRTVLQKVTNLISDIKGINLNQTRYKNMNNVSESREGNFRKQTVRFAKVIKNNSMEVVVSTSAVQ